MQCVSCRTTVSAEVAQAVSDMLDKLVNDCPERFVAWMTDTPGVSTVHVQVTDQDVEAFGDGRLVYCGNCVAQQVVFAARELDDLVDELVQEGE